jgi:hypothetical protein
MHWRSFLIGLLCGTFIGILSISLVGNRYKITPHLAGWSSIKLDTWTGKSWEYNGGYWKEIKK